MAANPPTTTNVIPATMGHYTTDATGADVFMLKPGPLWTKEAMKTFFSVGPANAVGVGHILIPRFTANYQNPATGEVKEGPLDLLTGAVRLPFETTGLDRKGEQMNPIEISFVFVDPNEPAKRFVEVYADFLTDWVIETNPSTPSGGKYFRDQPTPAAAAQFVRTPLFSNKVDKEGVPFQPVMSVRAWANDVDSVFEDAGRVVPGVDGYARGNTLICYVRVEGMVLASTSIGTRVMLLRASVIERPQQRANTNFPGLFDAHATPTSAPKANSANSAFGGIQFGDDDLSQSQGGY